MYQEKRTDLGGRLQHSSVAIFPVVKFQSINPSPISRMKKKGRSCGLYRGGKYKEQKNKNGGEHTPQVKKRSHTLSPNSNSRLDWADRHYIVVNTKRKMAQQCVHLCRKNMLIQNFHMQIHTILRMYVCLGGRSQL